MNETFKFWLECMYDKEIEESEASIRNEHIWAFGSTTEEEMDMHTENAENMEAYIEVLKELKNNLLK